MRPEISPKIQPTRLIPILTAGALIAVIDIVFEISMAALIFSGSLVTYLPVGIGLFFFGAIVINLIVSLTSSRAGMIAMPQESSAAVMAVVAATIVASMPAAASVEETFLTVLGAIVLTSVLAGIFFIVLGLSRLGRLVRYVPYPVIGGFLAGTGWVLFQGGFSLLVDSPIIPNLLQTDTLLQWVPAVIFGILLLVAERRKAPDLLIPILTLLAVILFYLGLRIAGVTPDQATTRGWLLGEFPSGALWQPATIQALLQSDWSVIAGQMLQIGSILIVSVFALLFNISGLEMTIRQDIDMDRELSSAGFANLVAGLGGSPIGFQALSYSALAQRLGAKNRLVGVVAAVVTGLTLLFGGLFLPYFPKIILGGLLLYMGLSFLVEWVYDAWFSLPRTDYGLMLLILVIVALFGFLEGVSVGIGIAVVMFVINYSRIEIIKHALSGESYRSKVARPSFQLEYLRKYGNQLLILQLQGFIFFGTAYSLLNMLKERIHATHLPPLKYLLLDFRLVNGLDSSAVSSFIRLNQLAQANEIELILTDVSRQLQARLERVGFQVDGDQAMRYLPTLDYGVEFCEERILEAVALPAECGADSLQVQIEQIVGDPQRAAYLMAYLEKKDIAQGEYLMRQGDTADCLYFVESGKLSVQLELNDGKIMRVATMQCGTVVGEMGLYLGQPRTASVLASEPSVVYRLCAEKFQRMQDEHPNLAAILHQWMAKVMAGRLTDNIQTIRELLE